MMFFGADCSSLAVHGVVLNAKEEIVSLHKWGSAEKDFTARFPEILVEFSEKLSKINIIDSATIEAAIFIQNPKTTIAIAHVVGACWFVLEQAGITPILVDNRQWKKGILDKGNASKVEIKQFATDKWGEVFPEQDYADAVCIALWNKRRNSDG